MSELVLADTSIWITHLRQGDKHFIQLLELGYVSYHPFIVVELACGSLKNRREIIQMPEDLPMVGILEHGEVMAFIESHKLMSLGIGYIDTHLLGSALFSDVPSWTFDKSLNRSAALLGVKYNNLSLR